jgi:hypothetical protein
MYRSKNSSKRDPLISLATPITSSVVNPWPDTGNRFTISRINAIERCPVFRPRAKFHIQQKLTSAPLSWNETVNIFHRMWAD